MQSASTHSVVLFRPIASSPINLMAEWLHAAATHVLAHPSPPPSAHDAASDPRAFDGIERQDVCDVIVVDEEADEANELPRWELVKSLRRVASRVLVGKRQPAV